MCEQLSLASLLLEIVNYWIFDAIGCNMSHFIWCECMQEFEIKKNPSHYKANNLVIWSMSF